MMNATKPNRGLRQKFESMIRPHLAECGGEVRAKKLGGLLIVRSITREAFFGHGARFHDQAALRVTIRATK
jgi:hypothetical protein